MSKKCRQFTQALDHCISTLLMRIWVFPADRFCSKRVKTNGHRNTRRDVWRGPQMRISFLSLFSKRGFSKLENRGSKMGLLRLALWKIRKRRKVSHLKRLTKSNWSNASPRNEKTQRGSYRNGLSTANIKRNTGRKEIMNQPPAERHNLNAPETRWRPACPHHPASYTEWLTWRPTSNNVWKVSG